MYVGDRPCSLCHLWSGFRFIHPYQAVNWFKDGAGEEYGWVICKDDPMSVYNSFKTLPWLLTPFLVWNNNAVKKSHIIQAYKCHDEGTYNHEWPNKIHSSLLNTIRLATAQVITRFLHLKPLVIDGQIFIEDSVWLQKIIQLQWDSLCQLPTTSMVCIIFRVMPLRPVSAQMRACLLLVALSILGTFVPLQLSPAYGLCCWLNGQILSFDGVPTLSHNKLILALSILKYTLMW